MKLYDEAFKAAALVVGAYGDGTLEGSPADNGISLPWVCQIAINAGPGDHLEIGTSFGASAIAVALAKKAAGLPGKVYCIDPYKKIRTYVHHTKGGTTANISTARRNIKKAEVDISIIRAPSYPFPEKLEDHKFVSAYIDGNHTADWPKNDIAECKKRVQHFIGIDNYEEGYPDIMTAVHDAIQERDWNIYFKNFLFVALRPVMHPRNSLLSTRLEHL